MLRKKTKAYKPNVKLLVLIGLKYAAEQQREKGAALRSSHTKADMEHDNLSFGLKAQAHSLRTFFLHLVLKEHKELFWAKILNCRRQKKPSGSSPGLGFAARQQWGSPREGPPQDRGAALGHSSDTSGRCKSTGETAAPVQGKFTGLSGSESRLEAKRKSKQQRLRD